MDISVDHLCIASIYPGKKQPIRKGYGPSWKRGKGTSHSFALEPVKRGGKPFVLRVPDCFQHYRDEFNSGKPWKMDPVECEQIVNNLVTEWAGNIPDLPAGAFPGIMRIVGNVPTQAEIAEMEEGLTAYMEFMFIQGENESKTKAGASPESKLAAEWLGRPTSWGNAAQILQTVLCPSCRQPIPPDAARCHHCTAQVKEFTGELALLNNSFVGPEITVPEEVTT